MGPTGHQPPPQAVSAGSWEVRRRAAPDTGLLCQNLRDAQPNVAHPATLDSPLTCVVMWAVQKLNQVSRLRLGPDLAAAGWRKFVTSDAAAGPHAAGPRVGRRRARQLVTGDEAYGGDPALRSWLEHRVGSARPRVPGRHPCPGHQRPTRKRGRDQPTLACASAGHAGADGIKPEPDAPTTNAGAAGAGVLIAKNLDVERAVKHRDEQAGLPIRSLVSHRLSSVEVCIGSRSNDVVVGLEPSFEDHDGVCRRVPMHLALRPGGVADEVVLFA